MNGDRVNWHDEYDDPGSPLAIRLGRVQDEIRQAIARRPVGPVRLASVCAGEGRDVIATLDHHPRGADVHAARVVFEHSRHGLRWQEPDRWRAMIGRFLTTRIASQVCRCDVR